MNFAPVFTHFVAAIAGASSGHSCLACGALAGVQNAARVFKTTGNAVLFVTVCVAAVREVTARDGRVRWLGVLAGTTTACLFIGARQRETLSAHFGYACLARAALARFANRLFFVTVVIARITKGAFVIFVLIFTRVVIFHAGAAGLMISGIARAANVALVARACRSRRRRPVAARADFRRTDTVARGGRRRRLVLSIGACAPSEACAVAQVPASCA